MENYYIVRAEGAGVFFGKIKSQNNGEVEMTDVRKLWYWDGASAVEQLALEGTKKPSNCKFTVTVDEMTIFKAMQIIKCSAEAIENIKGVPEWKQQ